MESSWRPKKLCIADVSCAAYTEFAVDVRQGTLLHRPASIYHLSKTMIFTTWPLIISTLTLPFMFFVTLCLLSLPLMCNVDSSPKLSHFLGNLLPTNPADIPLKYEVQTFRLCNNCSLNGKILRVFLDNFQAVKSSICNTIIPFRIDVICIEEDSFIYFPISENRPNWHQGGIWHQRYR